MMAHYRPTVRRRWPVALVAVLVTATLGAQPRPLPQTPPAPTPTPGASRPQGAPPFVQQVRIALGHGALDEARRLVAAAPATAGANRELAAALVDIYEGKDADAKTKLTPLATANPRGDAALELGLLELRHGRRDEARRLLDPLVAVRQFQGPDDYLRLARAARAVGERLLANDAYVQVKDVARADIQSEWGDLWLDYEAWGDATTSYTDALKADPAWIPALVGLARAKFGDGHSDVVPEGRAALERAGQLAPTSPDVWLLVAQQRIENDDFAGTIEALDRVAKVRPDTIDEAALRVALAYESPDRAALDAAIARVAAINPRSARGYLAAGQQAVHDYRSLEAADFARKAVELDPADPDAHADLGLYLLRAGDEKGARVSLERSWSLTKRHKMTKNLLDMMDSLEKFVVVQDGDLTFKFAPEDAPALRPYALPLGREAYEQFKTRYGFTPKGPILVEIFPTHDDFAVRTIGLPGITGALGACFGQVVSMDSPRARNRPGEFSWQATEWHELAHVFSLQLSDYRVPRWLTEGISVFEEHRRNPAWGRENTLEYAHALGRGKTFGVKGLPEAFKNPANYSMAYFEASLVVEHLVEINGDQGLRTLLKAYAERATDAQAFSRAFGKSLDDVETSFKAFVERRYAPLRAALAEPPRAVDAEDLEGLKARAAAAPGNFVSQMSLGAALIKARDLPGARAAFERAAALAPQASGDDSPHAVLAMIATETGDPARARQELRALLVYDHTNVNAARRLAILAAEAKATDDEEFALRLVADLDPFDGDVHGRLGRRLMAKSQWAPALVEFQAALATGPANLAEAHADVSEAFLKLGKRDEAKREAIAALKEAPTFARAQDLLLAAIGREPGEKR